MNISTPIAEVNRAKLHTALADGHCIGLPTETVYGLAADATNGIAVARIFEMKGRPKFNPLICHVSDVEMARKYGQFNDLAEKLAETFWPGPLTLVLPVVPDSGLHPLVTAELGTVGLRCPKGIAAEIIAEFGKPLAAPSANRSGRVSPTTARHVKEEFGDELLVVDMGPCEVGLESTIIKVDGNTIRLLRPGAITAEAIETVTGIAPETSVSDKIEAPGMMKSHYAPKAEIKLECSTFEPGAAVLVFGTAPNPPETFFNLSTSGNLREAAANLYAGMKALDQLGVETICVMPIPNHGLGVAINDRLQRAAAPRDT